VTPNASKPRKKRAVPPGGGTRGNGSISSLQVELARQILKRMQDEGWRPGRRVPEQTFARLHNVSRSPVRAALGLLVSHGLLRNESRRGFILARDVAGESIEQLIPPSVEEQLYAALIADRAAGRIAQEVSEAEMMPRYATSRGVIRKVFMRLAAEGLVSRQRGHGWRFADSLDTEQGILDSYRFRMTVECAALRQPGYGLEPAQIARLRAAHEAILAKGRAKTGGAEWFAVNADFHETIAGGSRNRFFLQAVRQQNSLRRIQEFGEFPHLSSERIIQSCREHLEILDALARGDRHWAEALLMRHLELAVRYIAAEDSAASKRAAASD
jgi:DNA-binding GntR family transcriptional regulator